MAKQSTYVGVAGVLSISFFLRQLPRQVSGSCRGIFIVQTQEDSRNRKLVWSKRMSWVRKDYRTESGVNYDAAVPIVNPESP